MNTSRKRRQGFGLIEILVTLGILTVGILGVATLHGVLTRQSGDNKARAEAMTIAQSRIEDMRNYTNLARDETAFNLLYADTVGFANSTTINGINAVFTRSENISTLASGKDIVVNVAWTGADGAAENVVLATELVFVSPRSVADAAVNAAPELVDSPTGRARLGEGQLPEDAVTISNDDGTALYDDDGTDLMLVSDGQIVLTLAMACQTDDGTCIDFVKIKGRIWIDAAAQNVNPGDVFVFASDAAFCARYYTVGTTTHRVTTATTTALATPNGNYKYFDYTCYIGGGWHGNVGILLAGGLSQQDKVCMGDPVSLNPWERPVLAARRAYRGMLYRHDAGEDDGREKVPNTDLVRYFSQGIIDQAELPLEGDGSHDFVITRMPSSVTDDASCVSRGSMVRADASINGVVGALFQEMPTDFVCLNNGLLDHFDAAVYGYDTTCPYDPTDPPIDKHSIKGSIRVSGNDSDTNANIVAAMGLVTQDGPGNCVVADFSYSGSYYEAAYSCDVFDWGNGWNGYIELVYTAAACSTDTLTFSNIRADSLNNNLHTCAIAGGSTGEDPGAGSRVFFSGIVTSDSANNRELASVTLSGGGTCALSTDGKSYSCSTPDFVGTWSGSITFSADALVCTATRAGANPAQFSYTGLSAGSVIRDLTLKTNAQQCP
jgi:Tfp pilus assembly protein PilV